MTSWIGHVQGLRRPDGSWWRTRDALVVSDDRMVAGGVLVTRSRPPTTATTLALGASGSCGCPCGVDQRPTVAGAGQLRRRGRLPNDSRG